MDLFLRNLIISTVLMLVLVLNLKLHLASGAIGANYGMVGDNLPSPSEVINLYKQEKITLMRLFEPNTGVLEALKGSGIKVAMGARNEDISSLAKSASDWVKANVVPYAKEVNFGWITLGNEMVPGKPSADQIPKAMKNMYSALQEQGLTGIKVSTVVHSLVLGSSFPPSNGNFSEDASGLMKEIISWLVATDNPLLANVYPYFPCATESNIPLNYALFNAHKPVLDGEYTYNSMFEAMVDAFYWAMEKSGGGNVTLVVSETGWPTAGNEPHITSKENARMYNQNLIDKMKEKGTPRKSAILDIFIFDMFDENQKPGDAVEQHWGMHSPNMQPAYPLKF